MASRHFRIELIARCVLAAATAYLFFFLLAESRFPLASALVGALSAVQCVLIVLRVDRRNRILERFFKAINDADYSQACSIPEGGSLGALRTEYLAAMKALRRYRLEGERRDQYLEMIAKGVGVGFAVLDAEGRVDFANQAFYAALGRPEMDGAMGSRFMAMKNGETELLAPAGSGDIPSLLVSARDQVLLGRKYRLVSVQNIRRELEENEMDAWQKLARVLTHEIMNSVAPISSLAFSAKTILARLFGQDGERGREPSEAERDAMSALETIGKRSRGLLLFVENYRKLLRVPTPSIGTVPCEDMLREVEGLMGGTLRERGIAFSIGVAPVGLKLMADRALVEQVLINLVKNSAEALEASGKAPAIHVRACAEGGGRPVIEVADNGPGIPEELLEKIFVPFFTTKIDGSGIGLSLCRQIMRRHGGSISVESSPGKGASFYLRF